MARVPGTVLGAVEIGHLLRNDGAFLMGGDAQGGVSTLPKTVPLVLGRARVWSGNGLVPGFALSHRAFCLCRQSALQAKHPPLDFSPCVMFQEM